MKKPCLVGGFNPFEKYSSIWIISPNRGENKKYLKAPPGCELMNPLRVDKFNTAPASGSGFEKRVVLSCKNSQLSEGDIGITWLHQNPSDA